MAVGDILGGKTIEVKNTRGPQLVKTEDGKNIYIDTKVTVRQDGHGKYIANTAKIELIQYNGAGFNGVPIRTLGTKDVGKPWVMNKALTDPSNAGLSAGQLKLIKAGPTQQDIEKSLGNLQSSLNKNTTQHAQSVLSAKLDTTSGNPIPSLPGKDNTQQSSAEALGQNKANEYEVETIPAGPEPTKSKSTFTDSGEDKITRKNYGTFMYPENLGETTQDYIKIDMMKYDTAGLDITKDRAGLGGIGNNGKERKSIGSVILPIPGGIKDSNKATWGGETLNAVEMAAASLALETIKKGTKGAAGELSNIANSIKTDDQGLEGLKDTTAALFASAAIGKDFKSLMGRTTGQILNPNMELLFQSPSLRPFSFTFLLAPRTKSEAQQVIQIIRFFKQGMAPIRSEAHLFLKAPNTFQLQYKHRGENHPYLNKFKECALQNCEINYTPQNNYSTFEDGVMNAYEMTLSFQELTPIYNDDYEDTTASSLTDGVEWDLVGDYSGLGGRPGDESGPEIGY